MIKRIVQTVALAVLFLSIMAADSESWLPMVALLVSGLYLSVVAWKSGLLSVYGEDEE